MKLSPYPHSTGLYRSYDPRPFKASLQRRDIQHAFKCITCGWFVSWHFGAADDHPNDCDDCAVEKMRAEEAA